LVLWKRNAPPVPYSGKRHVVWIEPVLIAEFKYRFWTADNKLHHAAYKGMRDVMDNAEIDRLED